MQNKIFRVIKKVIGVILIFIGIIGLFLPIIQGILLIIAGLLLLGLKKEQIRIFAVKLKKQFKRIKSTIIK